MSNDPHDSNSPLQDVVGALVSVLIILFCLPIVLLIFTSLSSHLRLLVAIAALLGVATYTYRRVRDDIITIESRRKETKNPTSRERRVQNVSSLKERPAAGDEIDYFFEHGHFPGEQ